MSARFLHTADWHLGKPFNQIPGDAGARLREARFEAVARIATLARERQVDAVLVAGDVFDDNLVAEKTLARALAAMRGFVGLWIVIPGNHDAALAESAWTRLARLETSKNIRLALTAEPITAEDGRWTVLPSPLVERRTMDDTTIWMNEAPSRGIRIGLAHGSVERLLPEAAVPTNPIGADRADRAKLDYLALGDWHVCREVGPRTWYAGTPEPDSWRARDGGRALLVEIAGQGSEPQIEHLEVGRFSWHDEVLDLTQGDIEVAVDSLMSHLQSKEHALLALRLVGAVGIAGREAVDGALARWAPRLHHLEVDDTQLRLSPEDQDLLGLNIDPLVAAVADRLRVRLASRDEDEREAAALALRLLWRETVEAERGR